MEQKTMHVYRDRNKTKEKRRVVMPVLQKKWGELILGFLQT